MSGWDGMGAWSEDLPVSREVLPEKDLPGSPEARHPEAGYDIRPPLGVTPRFHGRAAITQRPVNLRTNAIAMSTSGQQVPSSGLAGSTGSAACLQADVPPATLTTSSNPWE